MEPLPLADTNEMSAGPDSEASSLSPSRAPKRTRDTDTELDSNIELSPKPTPLKKVRFHPETKDNSLWAELNDAKFVSEPFRTQAVSPFPEEMENVFKPRPTLSSMFEVHPASLSSQSMFPEPRHIHFPVGPARLSSPTPNPIPLARAVSTTATAAMTTAEGRDMDTNSDTPSDRDRSSSLCAEYGDRSARHDCDDVSLPRSSPPPVVRRLAYGDWNNYGDKRSDGDGEPSRIPSSAKGKAKGKAKAKGQNKPPSIFTRPPPRLSGLSARNSVFSRIGLPLTSGSMDPDILARPEPPRRTKEEITRCSHVLLAAIAKLPAEGAREAREALEQLIRWQGQCGYEAGYRDGMRLQVAGRASPSEVGGEPRTMS